MLSSHAEEAILLSGDILLSLLDLYLRSDGLS
jgi:hypothetical protein